MPSLLRLVLVAVFGAALWAPASAQVPECEYPDDDPPLVYNFAIGPSLMPLGTEIRASVDETLTCASSITGATLQIDQDPPVSMFPRDGRFGYPDQFEDVFYVFPPGTLGLGTYDVTIVGFDGAEPNPNASLPLQRRIYHFGPLVAGDCRELPEGAC